MKTTQAQAATAEVGEGRERAKGHTGPHPRGRTQCRAARSRALDRGRPAARESARRLTARWPPVDAIDRRREASDRRKHEAAPGVDGPTWAAYGAPRAPPLRDGADRLQRGAYPASPRLAPRSRHAACDRWAAPWRRRHARGEVSIGRYGDDGIGGCQPKGAAEPWRSALRERCHRCPRALPPEQTRRRAWGRCASDRRQRRGQGQPATGAFLGVPHRCGTTKRGQWTVRRCPSATRRRKTRQEVQQTLRARRHWPLEQRGAWPKRGVSGHDRYDGVPRPRGRLWVLRERLRRYGCRILRRRSQRHRRTWQRRDRLAPPWLPETRQDASVSRATPARHDPRQEPGAVVPHAGIWAGGVG
jgi:RNA-directed DNA polymerase